MLEQNIYQHVRLKPAALDAIVTAFKENFASTDHLWIFGSRVNMNARGGDIDLYIETSETDTKLIIKQRAKFVGAMWKSIGEQKIDVVIRLTMDQFHLPIYDEARNNGVQLA